MIAWAAIVLSGLTLIGLGGVAVEEVRARAYRNLSETERLSWGEGFILATLIASAVLNGWQAIQSVLT